MGERRADVALSWARVGQERVPMRRRSRLARAADIALLVLEHTRPARGGASWGARDSQHIGTDEMVDESDVAASDGSTHASRCN